MRRPRWKAPASFARAYYHCISRVVDKQMVFGVEEREQFVAFMREYERFCGVRVVTYCVMSNHFHILLEVPEWPQEPLSDEALVELLNGLSGMSSGPMVGEKILWLRKNGAEDAAEVWRQRVMSVMWDVSGFMKLLKQRFTQWFNRRKGRKGTLWEERFKSVLVDGAGEVLSTMAAYIDLNPVRAGLVEDPKDYRWCGYGEAVSGRSGARAGLEWVMSAASRGEVKGLEAMKMYRVWLFGQGEQKGMQEDGQAVKKGFSRETVLQVVREKGRLPLAEYLRLRVRYFADGAVLGTRGFVNEIFGAMKDRFGPKRKDGARRMRGVQNELYSMRALRIRPLS
jgi:putative transposase